MLKLGSLCSGAGGLDMAVEEVFGAETVWHCEIDPAASKVLAYRWPGVPNHGDITAVDWDSIEPVDILAGGYPCQPFSQAGQRKGSADERHIWPDVREAIRRLRPRFTFLENVAGHRSLGFDRVLGDLAEDGMHVRWTSLRAAAVGAPHGRERLWIVVTPDSGGLRLGGSAQRDIWPLQPEFSAPQRRDADGCRMEAGGARLDLLPTPTTRDYKGGVRTVRDGSGRRAVTISDTTVSRGAGRASSLADVAQLLDSETRWGKYAASIARWESVTRTAPSATELNTKGNPRLNPAFSEWMQGWPAGWVTALVALGLISRNDALRIIGNGVVPQCAAAALTWLLSLEVAT